MTDETPSAETPATPPRSRRVGAAVSAVTVAALAALGLVGELVARAAWSDGYQREVRRTQAMLAFVSPCLEGVSAHPSPGVTRIAVVGESNASLLGDLLRDELGRLPCGQRYEVLNCGAPGSARQVMQRRFDEVMGHHPAAVLMLFGHNFRFSDTLYSPRRLRLQAWMQRSALLTALAAALPDRWWRTPEADPDESAPVDDDGDTSPDARKRLTLQRVVRSMARRARASGVTFAFATMASNLRMPPFVEPDALRDPARVDAQYRHAAGDLDGALRAMSAGAPDAYAAFQSGGWLLDAGRADDARERLLRAVDLDGMIPRAPRRLNDAYRQIAADEHAVLTDVERMLAARAPRGIPGWESYTDCCHFRPPVAQAVVRALFAAVRVDASCELPAEPSRADIPTLSFLQSPFELVVSGDASRDALAAQLAAAERVREALDELGDAADGELQSYLRGESFARLPPDMRARVYDAVAEGYWRAGRRERALAVNDLARAAPGADAWVQRGLWMLTLGRADEARAAWQRALRDEPGRADATRYLSLAQGAGR